MSMTLDSMRCPRCGGDMLTVTHNLSLEQNRECYCCGMGQELRYSPKTHMLCVRKEERPDAFIYVEGHDGNGWGQAFYGPGVYHEVKAWRKIIRSQPHIYNLARCYGTVWSRKHKKLRIVFGENLPIYGDAYYEDEDDSLPYAEIY